MTRRIIALAAIAAVLLSGIVAGAHTATRDPLTLAVGDVQPVHCADGTLPLQHAHGARRDVFCPTPEPPVTGWHAPGAHDGLNVHEHGESVPSWVTGAFTQSRESHTGYKGIYAVSSTGVESYLITHIISTVSARSHGDHDYQLWVRDPDTLAVYAWEGVLDFGNPPPLRTVDTGERPIILGERNATDGCETWYQRPGALVFDLGWTICDRYQAFDGTVLGGVGTFRSADWLIPCDRLPASHSLQNNCRVEFGVNRITWLVTGKQFPRSGVQPIN